MQANSNSGWEYQIRIEGKISQRWLAWFEGLAITTTEEHPGRADGCPAITTLTGLVADQAALAGLLQKLYTLGLPLLEVRRKETVCMDNAAGDPGEARAQGVNTES
jgi:hypothetical protein